MLIHAEDEPVAETRITNAQGQAYEVAMVQCRHKSKGEGGEKKRKKVKKLWSMHVSFRWMVYPRLETRPAGGTGCFFRGS